MHTFTAQSHARPHSHHHAGQSAAAAGSAATAAKSKLYNPRHPERTLLYQTIAENFETWFELASAGQFDGQGDHHTPKPYVCQAFRKYLESGIFAHGFARAWCDDCGHDYFVAFSCKGRGVYAHSGFSVDAGVCIEAHDRAALERLLRYCARPPFAMERLRKEGAALVYRCAKQHSEPGSDKRGTKADELTLTPLELIARIAALVPPPRTHRHRYFGVLTPNSPLRAVVTATAASAQAMPTQPAQTGANQSAPGVLPQPTPPEPVPPKRAPSHYLWAVLIARIYEVLPLVCPLCGGQMHLIAFITHSADIRQILDHIGVESEPPHITPARGPPLWDDCGDAQMGEGVEVEPDWVTDWDGAAQPGSDYGVDQRINW